MVPPKINSEPLIDFTRRRSWQSLCAAAILIGISAGSGALAQQTYPSKPIRLVVPFTSGGGTDTVARLLAQKLQESLGQPVVVDNKPGAGGSIGADAVAKSSPDGYTLLLTTNSLTVNAASAKTPYDPVKDFSPISTFGTASYLLVVRANSPVKKLDEFLRMTKSSSKMNFGSSGQGGITHLLGERLKQQSGSEAQHITYKGASAAITDLIGGQIDFMFGDPASLMPHIRSGKLRALATTSPARSELLPDVPTFQESGLPLTLVGFYGIMAPAGLPVPIQKRLNDEVRKVLQMPDVKQKFAASLTDPVGSSPEELAQIVREEIKTWTAVVSRLPKSAD